MNKSAAFRLSAAIYAVNPVSALGMSNRSARDRIVIALLALSASATGFAEAAQEPAASGENESEIVLQAQEPLRRNGIDTTNLNIERVLDDSVETVVWAEAVHDGLPVFGHRVGYVFNSGGELETGPDGQPLLLGEKTPSSVRFPSSKIPTIDECRAVEIFRPHVQENPSYGISQPPSKEVTIRLGFTDAGRFSSHSQSEDIRLAWMLTPTQSRYPRAIVDALTGRVLSYDSGVRTSRPRGMDNKRQ